jgi:proteic killer suppression protein
VIQGFRDPGTEDIFSGRSTKAARSSCPEELRSVATRKLEYLDSAKNLQDLRVPPGNRLEALAGNLRGRHSIRVNDRYRICFIWTALGPNEVVIVDYH